MSYVGRQGRKLFTQADAAQILDFKDNASGQFIIDAFNRMQVQLEAGGAITVQPWFENQVGQAVAANYGTNCTGVAALFGVPGVPNCSAMIATFFGGLSKLAIRRQRCEYVCQGFLNRTWV